MATTAPKQKWKIPKGMILCEWLGPVPERDAPRHGLHRVRVRSGRGRHWTGEGTWSEWCVEGCELWVQRCIELPAEVVVDVGANFLVRPEDVVAVREPT